MRQIRTSDSCRILVVEDDLLLRDVIVDILAEAGYATSEAACAGEALELLDERSEIAAEIAVVVTDIDMPGDLDGLGLAARLGEVRPQIGVIVTSGAHRGAAAALCRPALFLAKPFRADRLVAAVHSVMEAGLSPQKRFAS